MGRKKEFKSAKSFTLTIKNLAWLEEQCYEQNAKASVIIEKLITKERHRLREKQEQTNTFYCTNCEKDQLIIVKGFATPKFYCAKCNTDLTISINTHLEIQGDGSKTKGPEK